MKLRKLTPSLARKREAARRSEAGEASWKARYAFLKEAVEDLDEELAGGKFEDIDVSLLDALFIRACDEYDRPATEAVQERINGLFDSMDLSKLQETLEAADKLANRQMFKNVR